MFVSGEGLRARARLARPPAGLTNRALDTNAAAPRADAPLLWGANAMAPPRRPAAGPVARNSVSYKIQIRASHQIALALRSTRTTPRGPALFDYPISYYPTH